MLKPAILALALAAASSAYAAEPGPARTRELQDMVDQDCGSCHGLTRQGGLGIPLSPEALADKPAEALVAAILDGRPGTPMPPWRGLLNDDDAQWIARMLKGEAASVR
jgi:cytochrome c55X